MSVDLIKYIFEESKKNGLPGVISLIVKLASFCICLSPVITYFWIYKLEMINMANIFFAYSLIIGLGCVLFFLVFISSKVFSSILLEKKLIKSNEINSKMNYEEMRYYYFKCSFIITTVFHATLTVVILASHYTINEINIQHLKDLKYVIILVVGFFIVSFVTWFFSLIRHIKALDTILQDKKMKQIQSSTINNLESVIKKLEDNENLIHNIKILLEKYDEDKVKD